MVLKTTTILHNINNYVYLQVDEQLGAYYRSLYSLEYFYRDRIKKPMVGTHISVTTFGDVLSTIPPKMVVEIEYLSGIMQFGTHFCLRIIQEPVLQIRKLLLLPEISEPHFHISIGNTK